MGGGNSGTDASQSEPPLAAETRQLRGESLECSHIPTQLPASVSMSVPPVWGTSLCPEPHSSD